MQKDQKLAPQRKQIWLVTLPNISCLFHLHGKVTIIYNLCSVLKKLIRLITITKIRMAVVGPGSFPWPAIVSNAPSLRFTHADFLLVTLDVSYRWKHNKLAIWQAINHGDRKECVFARGIHLAKLIQSSNKIVWYLHCFMQVVVLSTVPGRDVAEKTRNVSKKLMADPLQKLFNLEGRGMKNKKGLKEFPAVLYAVYGMLWNVMQSLGLVTV